MENSRRPQQKEGFLLEELDGELMLYSIATTRIFALNQSAALIWELCSGQYTVAEITSALAEAYPSSQDQIERQVTDTLALLLANGAIELH